MFPTPAALLLIAEALSETATDPRTSEDIRTMHQTPMGAEILRLIVRDDLAGASNIIAVALWNA